MDFVSIDENNFYCIYSQSRGYKKTKDRIAKINFNENKFEIVALNNFDRAIKEFKKFKDNSYTFIINTGYFTPFVSGRTG